MTEFKKEQKGESTFLSCMVDERAMDTVVSGMLQRNHIPGLLSFSSTQIDTERLCSFNITSKISLKQYFSRNIKKAVFLDMLFDIISIVSNAEEYLLRQSDFIFDDEYIFVSVSDGKPNLVCLPTPHEELGMELSSFFRRLVFETSFDNEEDRSYVAELNDFLKRPDSSNYQVFKSYLEKMKRQSTVSVTQTENRLVAEQPIPANYIHAAPPAPQSSNDEKKLEGSDISKGQPEQEKRGFFLFGGKKNNKKPQKAIPFEIPGISRGAETPAADTGNRHPIDTPTKPIEPPANPRPVSNPSPVVDLTSDETVVIDFVRKAETPWIVHLRTAHAQPVDHSPFRIGKKKEYVDFYIPGNAAVGRSHADIQIKDGTCWLVDNNSLNHTFLRGNQLEPGKAYQLKDKDRFVLANEEFLFELR